MTQTPFSLFTHKEPLKDPSYFTGPVVWWNAGLLCGGVERQIVMTARYFKEADYRFTYLCYSIEKKYHGDFFVEEAQRSFDQILTLPNPEVTGDAVAAILQRIHPKILRSCSKDVLHLVLYFTLWFLNIRPRCLHVWNADQIEPILAAAIARIPSLILSGQSLPPIYHIPYGGDPVYAKLSHLVLANIMRLPNVCMTNNSRIGARKYEEWLELKRNTIHYTPNLIDTETFKDPGRERIRAVRNFLGLPAGATVIGGLFRFVGVKNPDLWLKTVQLLLSDDPTLYAVLGGEGPLLSHIQEQIRHSPYPNRIICKGTIQDVPAFLTLCTVLLHTSHVEGLPNVILEAQMANVPVVTTHCGGVSDIVLHEKSGFIAEEKDAGLLAAYVKICLTRQDFARKAGEIGQKHVLDNFSPRVSFPRMLHVYEAMHVSQHNG